MEGLKGIFVLGVIVAAAVTVWLARGYARRKAADAALLGIYMNLLDLYGYYFWSVSSVNKEDSEIHEKVITLNRIINGYLPKINHLPFAQEIRELMPKADTRENFDATAKYRRLEDILKKIEAYIHKNNLAASRKILQNNLQFESRMSLQEDNNDIFNAPGFIDWVPGRNKNK